MKRLIRRIAEILRPYWKLELLGVFFTLLYTLAVFGSPLVSKYLIDTIIPTQSITQLYTGILLFFIVCVSQPIFGYIKNMIFLQITQRITLSIRSKLFQKIIDAPLTFFDQTQKGKIVSRVANDGRIASGFISDFFVVFIKNVAMIVMILGGMMYLSAKLTLIVLGLFAVYFVVQWKLGKRFDVLSDRVQRSFDKICTQTHQTADAIESVKTYGMEDAIKGNFQETLKEAFHNSHQLSALNILLNSLSNVIMITSLSVIYGLGSLDVMNGHITLGTVIAMGLYFQLLMQPIFELTNNGIQFQKNKPIFDRIYEYFDMEEDRQALMEESTSVQGVSMERVSFGYEEGETVLQEITLQIDKPGLYALVGHSGAGKSTVAKLLLGLYTPQSGSIAMGELNGRTTADQAGENSLRAKVSYVPQQVKLLNMSIAANLKCANPDITEEEMWDVLMRVGLHDKIKQLDNGLHATVQERENFSGGELQRLGIARALLKDAPVFIFDEPTAALDAENEAMIRGLIEQCAAEKIVLVIAHRLSTIMNAKQVFLMSEGSVAEVGNHQHLMEQGGQYAKFVMEQRGQEESLLA